MRRNQAVNTYAHRRRFAPGWSHSFPKRIQIEPRYAVGIVDFDFDLALDSLRHVGIRGTGALEALDRDRLYRLLSRYLGKDETRWNPGFRKRVTPVTAGGKPDKRALAELALERARAALTSQAA